MVTRPQGRNARLSPNRRTAFFQHLSPWSHTGLGQIDHADSSENVRTVVIDELHAFAADDRGWHLLSVFAGFSDWLAGPSTHRPVSPRSANPKTCWRGWRPALTGPADSLPQTIHEASTEVQLDFVGSLPNAARSFACCTRARSDWFSATALSGGTVGAALAGTWDHPSRSPTSRPVPGNLWQRYAILP